MPEIENSLSAKIINKILIEKCKNKK